MISQHLRPHSRPHPRMTVALSAAISALLLIGLLWLLQPAPTLLAQSQPDVLGKISGTVRNEQGDPLANILVSLYQPAVFGDTPLRSATTNAQGVYSLLSIPPGAYQVRYEDKGKSYASLFYGPATTLDDAAVVNVSGNQVSGIDIQLALGGSISVTIEPALSITTSSVYLNLFAKTSTGHWRSFDTLYWPNSNPELTFTGLPSATYRLCAQPTYADRPHDWAECFDNVLYNSYGPPDNATDIVINGVEHKTIAFHFGDLTQLQGFVRSPDGQPVPYAQLTLQSIPNSSGSAAGYGAQTNAQGYFQFERLIDFAYTLQVFDPSNRYVPIYYDNATDIAQAKPIQINQSSRYSLTLTVPQTGHITGKIRLQGGGVPPYALIFIYKEPLPGNPWESNQVCLGGDCFANYDPASGVYTVTGLTTGVYRVGATVYSYPVFIPTDYYGGQELQSAADIAVTTGKTTPNINITIGEGAFDSSIQGAATANGAPAAGIEVGLFTYDPNNGPYYAPPIVSTQTDNQGNYRFDGLPNGGYAVGFRDPNSVYAMTFYGGNATLPTQILITHTTTISAINAALTEGATIRGKVKRVAGRNAADLVIHTVAPPFYTLTYLNVETDINGNFEIKSVPAGSYWIGVDSPADASLPGAPIYYPAAPDLNSAKAVVVAAGDLVTGINISVDIVPNAYLPTVRAGMATPAPTEEPIPTATPAVEPIPVP